MVLYSVITTYQLLEAMIHKIGYNKDEQGILLISHWLANKYEWYKQLNTLFDKVVVFNADYHFDNNVVAILNKYFNELFDDNDIEIEKMDEVHVFGAEHAFGVYVFSNQIRNCYWEEGAGALSKKDSMLELFEKAYGKDKAIFQYELHLGDGETSFVTSRFYDKYYQLQMVNGNNLIHFDIADELGKLGENERNQIVKLFYRGKKIISNSTEALVLTEHFANLSIMSWDEQLTMYKYFADYFLQQYKFLFKPHPDDTMYYEYEFPNCDVIRTRFPAELLPYIFDGRPGVVATSSSTSIYGFRNQFNKVLEFNFKFSHEKQFYNLNRYFVGLSIANKYIKNGHRLKLLGVNSPIIDNFYKFLDLGTDIYEDYGNVLDKGDLDIDENTIWVFDEIKLPHVNSKRVCEFLETIPDNNIVIFINSDENYCFYNYEHKKIWEFMIPVEIDVKTLPGVDHSVTFAGPSVSEDKAEMLYIYSKGEKINMYKISRELPNVGVSVSTKNFDGDKMQIKLLEGMLTATEKRLLYYIKREKELLNEGEK